ncbi:hypothetical protein D3C86_1225940 [compost metagenome]
MSFLPWTEASVRTRVVSWKDAAEMKLRVCSDALVMPSRTGCVVARRPPRFSTLAFSRAASATSTVSPRIRVVSPESRTSTFCSI